MLNQDFKEFLQSLNNNCVRYLVIGGYAVAFHGHPRYTKEIDVWIDRSEENAARLLKALDDFGFGSLNLAAERFLKPHKVFQLGNPPRRIDILTFPIGVEFDGCHSRRVEQTINGVLVPFIGLEDLKMAKRSARRHQDLADLDNLS